MIWLRGLLFVLLKVEIMGGIPDGGLPNMVAAHFFGMMSLILGWLSND